MCMNYYSVFVWMCAYMGANVHGFVCEGETIFALLNEPLGESQGGCSIPHAAVELLQRCNSRTL